MILTWDGTVKRMRITIYHRLLRYMNLKNLIKLILVKTWSKIKSRWILRHRWFVTSRLIDNLVLRKILRKISLWWIQTLNQYLLSPCDRSRAKLNQVLTVVLCTVAGRTHELRSKRFSERAVASLPFSHSRKYWIKWKARRIVHAQLWRESDPLVWVPSLKKCHSVRTTVM